MTTTEQIEQAAKDHAAKVLDLPHNDSYMKSGTDKQIATDFKAGADHVLSNPELMADFCTGLMQWVHENTFYGFGGKYQFYSGRPIGVYTLRELFFLYLEHLNTTSPEPGGDKNDKG